MRSRVAGGSRPSRGCASNSSRPKNYPFPGVFVFAHHDIDGEIPGASAPRSSWPTTLSSFVVCLFYNFFFCATAAMISFGAVTDG